MLNKLQQKWGEPVPDIKIIMIPNNFEPNQVRASPIIQVQKQNY